MKQSLIFTLLMVISSILFSSCAEEETQKIPIRTYINANGFLDNFRGGKIDVKIYNNTSNACSAFLDTENPVNENSEKTVSLNIPEGDEDIALSQTGIKIQPGVKTIHALLYDASGTVKGHACEKAFRCSYLKEDNIPSEAYNIQIGDRACVYLDLELIQ